MRGLLFFKVVVSEDLSDGGRDLIHARGIEEQPGGHLKEECSKQSCPSKSKCPVVEPS